MLRAHDYEDIFDLPVPSPADAEPALDAASAVAALLDAMGSPEENGAEIEDDLLDAAWDEVEVPCEPRPRGRPGEARP